MSEQKRVEYLKRLFDAPFLIRSPEASFPKRELVDGRGELRVSEALLP